MNFIVLSYPRTGSTVIQRVINTSPNSICIGEKPMAINHLAAFASSLIDAKTTIPQNLFPDIPLDDDRNPVYLSHLVDVDAATNYLKAVFVRHVLGVVHAENVGWKENFISSYPDEAVANAEIAFVRRLFPNILFILNIRDPEECANSSVWRFRDDAKDEISQRREWMLRGHETGLFGANCILLNHDEWKHDLSKLVGPLRAVGIHAPDEAAHRVASERLTHISNI